MAFVRPGTAVTLAERRVTSTGALPDPPLEVQIYTGGGEVTTGKAARSRNGLPVERQHERFTWEVSPMEKV